MVLIPRECIAVGRAEVREGQLFMSVRLKRHNREWRRWAWGFVRAEIARYRVPFWRWPQAARLVVRFVWPPQAR